MFTNYELYIGLFGDNILGMNRVYELGVRK